MAKSFKSLNDKHRAFISQQQMFFVATAPLTAEGHVNLSPKGLDSIRVIDKRTIVYLDLFGSGAETIAHIRENQRITLMFCAFEGDPNILRVYGVGEVVDRDADEYSYLRGLFNLEVNERSIIRINITRVQDSCGFAVPLYEYKGQRDRLRDWSQRKSRKELEDYGRKKNLKSIDGLPAWEPDCDH